MRKLLSISLAAMLMLSMACQKGQDTPNDLDSPMAKSLVQANNDFAFNLLKKVHAGESEENYMISPVSASLALGMTYNGTNGSTKTAFEDVLGYTGMSAADINGLNQQLISSLSTNTPSSTFNIANSIWYRNGLNVLPQFLNANQTHYDAAVRALNFDDPTAKDIINDWVDQKTNGKITSIIDQITGDDMMFLVNALYFKSDWKYQFDVNDTRPMPFYDEQANHLGDKPTMNMAADLDVLENSDFLSVKLPYKDDKFDMYIFLPNYGKTTADLVNMMDNASFNQWLPQYAQRRDFGVILPKFKFPYKNQFNDELIDMGLGVAFTRDADLSGINGARNLVISKVIQKTFIDVNEEGSEAAAVTSVGVGITSVGPATQIICNRPFAFIIADRKTKSICFVGKVGNPSY